MSRLPVSKFRPLGFSLLAMTFALAACQPKAGADASPSLAALDSSESALPSLPDVQPMVAGPAAPVQRAPSAAALPRTKTLGYASASGNDRYAWIDRANRINETIGDAPPDYGFDYQDGVQPYGWESAGGYRTYAEPVEGGYRTYYYDPGANEPYLVRDPAYSYGYSGGRIVTVYDRGGRALEGQQAQRQAEFASRYYDRGRSMRSAADARQRRGVAARGWADQREVITAQRGEWNRTQATTPEWRAYRDDHAVQDQRLADERTARARTAQAFSAWQGNGGRGVPPVFQPPRQDPRMPDRANAQRRQIQPDQQQASLTALAEAHNVQLREQRQQRDAAARKQSAAERANVVQQRDRAAKAAQLGRQHAAKLQAQQQRVAAQTERLRVARASQTAARQKRLAANTERLRLARERQTTAKAEAVRKRAEAAAVKAASKAVATPPRPVAAPMTKAPEPRRTTPTANPKVKPEPREPGLPHP